MYSIGTDIELLPKQLLRANLDDMSKAMLLRDIHGAVGTKSEPTTLEPGFVCHPDSCGVEFTTPPASSTEEFCDAIQHGVSLVSRHFGMDFVFLNRYDVGPLIGALQAIAPDVAKTILARGCDPDWWVPEPGMPGVKRPRPPAGTTLMELGGHLHIDTPKGVPDEMIVTMLAFVLKDHHSEYTNTWYRRPGLYRPKAYGIEYRSLGAEWASSRGKCASIFNTIQHHMESFND